MLLGFLLDSSTVGVVFTLVGGYLLSLIGPSVTNTYNVRPGAPPSGQAYNRMQAWQRTRHQCHRLLCRTGVGCLRGTVAHGTPVQRTVGMAKLAGQTGLSRVCVLITVKT